MLVVAVPEQRKDKPHLPFPVAHTTQLELCKLHKCTSQSERPESAATASVRIEDVVF
jgi:hypothetical protein